MSKRVEEKSRVVYPLIHCDDWDKEQELVAQQLDRRVAFICGYEQAEKAIIEHCEKRIAEYNAQNLSNMFLRRAFEDVIRFIKEIPYNDYKDEDHE